jgi:hypothetical protein
MGQKYKKVRTFWSGQVCATTGIFVSGRLVLKKVFTLFGHFTCELFVVHKRMATKIYPFQLREKIGMLVAHLPTLLGCT